MVNPFFALLRDILLSRMIGVEGRFVHEMPCFCSEFRFCTLHNGQCRVQCRSLCAFEPGQKNRVKALKNVKSYGKIFVATEEDGVKLMAEFECPICGSSNCKLENVDGHYALLRCEKGYTFGVSADILSMETEEHDKCFNLVLEHLLREKLSGKKNYWYFYFDRNDLERDNSHPERINLAQDLLTYPKGFVELVNRTMVNLSRLYPTFGDAIGYDPVDYHTAYCVGESAADEGAGFFDILVELGYLSKKDGQEAAYFISASGWNKIEELQKKEQEVKQGFIAMSFREETRPIRQAFREAIIGSGYNARLIDEKEHNNQIVPEIFYEIQRSKFIVVDITYPNYGAYYEAGYAQGLGKEVIVCCKGSAFNNETGEYERPHFDISQKSIVIWNSLEDLVARLKKRIEATVR